MASIESKTGFLGSNAIPLTIVQGTTGSTAEANMQRNYAFFVIRCENCANIPDTCTMTIQTKMNDGDTYTALYEINDPSTAWSKGVPTTGTLHFALSHAFGAKYLRLILSGNASGGDVQFKVYGFDPIVIEG